MAVKGKSILVIPDVHLKSFMLDQADKIIDEQNPDLIMFLGDYVDDFNSTQQTYKDFSARFFKFLTKHKDKVRLCWGNHDISYMIRKFVSGNKFYVYDIVIELCNLLEKNFDIKYVQKVDHLIFSHAGITDTEWRQQFLDTSTQKSIDDYNSRKYSSHTHLWSDESPLWARPQIYKTKMASIYDEDCIRCIQVIGHTPTKEILVNEKDSYISTDVFSTYSDGRKFGEEKFIIIDSMTGEFEKYE